jgi:hypothetical protein
MTIKEAAEVLAVDLNRGQCYDPDLKLFDPKDVMILCSSLITREKRMPDEGHEMSWSDDEQYVEVYSDVEYEESQDEIIRLAHLSVRDYLVSDRIKFSKAYSFAIDSRPAHTFIAQTCLVYLLHPAFALGYCDYDGIAKRKKDWPLYRYAVHFWPFHIKASDELLDNVTWHLLKQFFRTKETANGGNFAAWAVAFIPDTRLADIKYTQPLFYAASFGITSLIRKLLESDPDIEIDAPGGRYDSPPLHAAAYRNHSAAVKLLLEAGADPIAPNSLGESSLFWATVRDHIKVQRLLKSYGATFTQHDLRQLHNYHPDAGTKYQELIGDVKILK